MNKKEKKRQIAIHRYLSGEKAESIWISLGCSKAWFYKWLNRYKCGNDQWYKEDSRCPNNNPNRTPKEIEEIVKFVRLGLYNKGLFCGAQAIQWELEELNIRPLPSERTIGRILSRYELTNKRTGRYEPKGKKYPKLIGKKPGEVHQSDFVGPCYLTGGLRFYSLNSIDLVTGRCGIEPVVGGKKNIIEALWTTWLRMGIPKYQQIDNEMVFYGSPAYPRGMGKLIRLCLLNGVEPYFIPVYEPWHNGVVEKFNYLWRDKFLHRISLDSSADIKRESLKFENLHNSSYRYSKLGGKTPNKSLAKSTVELRFPGTEQPPKHPLPKPEKGFYHVVRFIRSDGILNIFGEKFQVPTEAIYEYVKTTIDVRKQKLLIYLDNKIIDERKYKLR